MVIFLKTDRLVRVMPPNTPRADVPDFKYRPAQPLGLQCWTPPTLHSDAFQPGGNLLRLSLPVMFRSTGLMITLQLDNNKVLSLFHSVLGDSNQPPSLCQG